MHTYVLTSFIVNLVCITLALLGSAISQQMSRYTVLALAWGLFCAIWSGALLFA